MRVVPIRLASTKWEATILASRGSEPAATKMAPTNVSMLEGENLRTTLPYEAMTKLIVSGVMLRQVPALSATKLAELPRRLMRR
jgi:hypothetical protein